MLNVALTGNIASGKSSVVRLFHDWGATIIDADAIVRRLQRPGTAIFQAIVDRFGPRALAPDGSLDRPALGAIVFDDEAARRRLEAIIHPLVRERGRELEEAAPDGAVVVHDIPLLAETGQADRFDAVLVVDVPVETQLARMVDLRGMSRAEAEARVVAQATRQQRLAVATHVIDNTGTCEDLRERVTEVFEELTG